MDKIQRLQQRGMSVDEYRQKMELYIMKVRIKEEEETTIFSGLNLEIRDRVKILPYQYFNDLAQIYTKVEQQLLRKRFGNSPL